MAQGNNEEITRFFNRGNTASVIGEREFIEWLKDDKLSQISQREWVNRTIPHGISIEDITRYTAQYFKQDVESLKQLKKGRYSQSEERKIAIFLCQCLGDHHLKGIGKYFGLGHVGSVSHITSMMRAELSRSSKLSNQIDQLCNYIINNAA